MSGNTFSLSQTPLPLESKEVTPASSPISSSSELKNLSLPEVPPSDTTLVINTLIDLSQEEKEQLYRIEERQETHREEQKKHEDELKTHLVTLVQGQQTLLSFLDKKLDEKKSSPPLSLQEIALQEQRKGFEQTISRLIKELTQLASVSPELPQKPIELADKLLKNLTYPVLTVSSPEQMREAQQAYTTAIQTEIRQSLEALVPSLGVPPCEYVLLELSGLAEQSFYPGGNILLGLLIEQPHEQSHSYFQMLRRFLELILNYQHQRGWVQFGYCLPHQGEEVVWIQTPKKLIEMKSQPMLTLYRASCLGGSLEGKRLFHFFQQELEQSLDDPQRYRLLEEALRPYRTLITQHTENTAQLMKALETACWTISIQKRLRWNEQEERSFQKVLSKLVKTQQLTHAFACEVQKVWETLQTLYCQQMLFSYELTKKDKALLRRLHRLILQPLLSVLLPEVSLESSAPKHLTESKGDSKREAKDKPTSLCTWVESPIPPHQPMVTQPALDPVFYEVGRRISQWKSSLLPLKVVKDGIEKALDRLLETLCERPTAVETFRGIYSLMPDEFKGYYYQALIKQLNEHTSQTVQRVLAMTLQYEEEQKEPSQKALSEAVESCLQARLSLSAQDILKAVSDFPCRNGQRPVMIEKTLQWYEVLSTQLTKPLASDVRDKQDKVKKDYSSFIQVDWVMPNHFSIQKGFLSISLQKYWQSKGWLSEEGEFTEKAKEALDGRGYVLPIENEEGQIIAYAKAYPELPGIQSLAQSLAWSISGEGPLSTLCRWTHLGTGKSYPVLLMASAGETLQSVLRREGNLSSFESKLDGYRFSLKVLESLLLSYEDDKFDNVSTSLISFDCDRAFVEPLQIEKGTFSTKIKVNSKTVLYCFNQMQESLHPEAIKVFLSLEPYEVLRYWLEEQERFQALTLSNSHESLFSLTEADTLRRRKEYSSTLHRVFVKDSGLVKLLYQRFRRIQSALEEEPTQTHFSLLRGIEPHLATFYEEAFKHPNPVERFQALPTDYVIIEDKRRDRENAKSIFSQPASPDAKRGSVSSHVSGSPTEVSSLGLEVKSISPPLPPGKVYQTPWKLSQTLSLSTHKVQLNLKDAIEQKQIDTPQEVLKKELGPLHFEYQQLDSIRDALLKGNLKPFQALGKDKDYFKERIVNAMDFASLSPEVQLAILESMVGGSYLKLRFIHCHVLNDKRLVAILKTCPNLHSLEIVGIQDTSAINKITSSVIEELAKSYCPRLERLTVRDLSYIDTVSQTNWLGNPSGPLVFPQLRRLVIDNASALSIINIDVPRIERLSIERCPRLTQFTTQQSQFYKLEPFIQGVAQRGERFLEPQDELGDSVLHRLARQGKLYPLQWLLKRFPQAIDQRNKAGDTVLMLASERGHYFLVQWLAETFPKALHIEDAHQQTAFYRAAQKGNMTITYELLKRGERNLVIHHMRERDIAEENKEMVQDLKGHSNGVFALATLSDGRLASGSWDHTIKLWNLRSGKCEQTLTGHSSSVSALSALSDSRLASGSSDDTIKLWNVKSGLCEQTLTGHSYSVNAFAVLSDGRLASGSWDRTIKLWNVKSGLCEQTLTGHSSYVYALSELSDGRLASGSLDKTIKLWNLRSGKCEQTLTGHSEGVSALSALSDGRLASGSYDNTIKLWNVRSGLCEQTLTGHSNNVSALAELLDGRLASGSWDNTIRLWNVRNGLCEQTLTGHSDNVRALSALSDGRLASGSWDNTIKLWNFPLRALSLTALSSLLSRVQDYPSLRRLDLQHTCVNDSVLPVLGKIIEQHPSLEVLDVSSTALTLKSIDTLQALRMHRRKLQLHHDFNREESLIRALNKNQVTALELSQMRTLDKDKKVEETKIVLKGHSHSVSALAELSDGRLASGSSDHTIKLWNVRSGMCEQTLAGHSNWVYALAELSDGRLASGSSDDTIKLWNVRSGMCEQTLTGHSHNVSALAELSDGRLASGSWDHTIKLWNVKSGMCEQTLTGHSNDVWALSELSDGRLASGSYDKTIKLWNMRSGMCEQTLTGHSHSVYALAELSDGRLASGSSDKTIKLWNVRNGMCEQTLTGHSYGVRVLAELPDGRLASGSLDNTIKLWNVRSGMCEQTLTGHSDSVYALVALSDGRLASGSYDHTIKLWNFPLRALSLKELLSLLARLKNYSLLRFLDASNTSLDDSALPHIEALLESNTQLELLGIRATAISLPGIERLQRMIDGINLKRLEQHLKLITFLHGKIINPTVYPDIAKLPSLSSPEQKLSVPRLEHKEQFIVEPMDSQPSTPSLPAQNLTDAPAKVSSTFSGGDSKSGDSKQAAPDKKPYESLKIVELEDSAALLSQHGLMSFPRRNMFPPSDDDALFNKKTNVLRTQQEETQALFSKKQELMDELEKVNAEAMEFEFFSRKLEKYLLKGEVSEEEMKEALQRMLPYLDPEDLGDLNKMLINAPTLKKFVLDWMENASKKKKDVKYDNFVLAEGSGAMVSQFSSLMSPASLPSKDALSKSSTSSKEDISLCPDM